METQEFLESSEHVFTKEEIDACRNNGKCCQCGVCCFVFKNNVPATMEMSGRSELAPSFDFYTSREIMVFRKKLLQHCPYLSKNSDGKYSCDIHGNKPEECQIWEGNQKIPDSKELWNIRDPRIDPNKNSRYEFMIQVCESDLINNPTPEKIDTINKFIKEGSIQDKFSFLFDPITSESEIENFFMAGLDPSSSELPHALFQNIKLKEWFQSMTPDKKEEWIQWLGLDRKILNPLQQEFISTYIEPHKK